MAKPLIDAFEHHGGRRPPFWFMRQAGRYLPEYRRLREAQPDFLAFCYTPDLAIEATLQPIRRFDMDAAILFSDILVVPDALGCKVSFVEGQGPVLEPVRSKRDVDALGLDHVEERLQPVFAAVRGIRESLPAEKTLIGFAGAPWTLAYYMAEGRSGSSGNTVQQWSYRDPETFQRLIDLLVEATVVHLDRQIEHGAEVVQIFDSWSGLLAERAFERWGIQPMQRIVRELRRRHPTIKIIGFARGSGVLTKAYAEQTGVDGLSIDSNIPLAWAKDHLQTRCLVQGNLDNHLLVAGGKELRDETINVLHHLSRGPFIFNLGHGVLPNTPVENVALVAETIHGWTPC